MRRSQPPVLDYSEPPPRSNVAQVCVGYTVGWLLGVVVTGVLTDVIDRAWRGHAADGGMYCVSFAAVVLEVPGLLVLRRWLGARRVGGGLAFLYGLACGPTLLAVLLVVGRLAYRQ